LFVVNLIKKNVEILEGNFLSEEKSVLRSRRIVRYKKEMEEGLEKVVFAKGIFELSFFLKS